MKLRRRNFRPGTLSVKKGQSINWTNGDDSPHQVSVASEFVEDWRAAQRTEWPAFGPGPGRPGLRPARDYSELYNELYNNSLK